MFSFVATVHDHIEQAVCGNKTVLIERGFAFGFILFYYYLRVRFGLPINDYALYLINKGYFEPGGPLLCPSNDILALLRPFYF